jgi:hypothetical protein
VSAVPDRPAIYHITHVDNLPSILAAGGLWSDAEMLARGGPAAQIGMSGIKTRRLGLPLKCHPGDHVGDYVPFYFCPRSVMLYILHCANHAEPGCIPPLCRTLLVGSSPVRSTARQSRFAGTGITEVGR